MTTEQRASDHAFELASEAGPARFVVELASGQRFGPADLPTIEQWARESRLGRDSAVYEVAPDGSLGERRWVMDVPSLAPILQAPPTSPGPVQPVRDDTASVIVPYRNPRALTGYYMSVFGLLMMLVPLLGLIYACIVVYLGVTGFRYARQNPHAHGSAHAWIAILLGMLEMIVGIGATVFAVARMLG